MVETPRRLKLHELLRVLVCMIALGTGLTLRVAAGLKLADLPAFADALQRQHAMTEQVSEWVPAAIAAAQLTLGAIAIWFLLRHRRAEAYITLALAFCGFTAYSAWLVSNPPTLPAPCGCGFSAGLYSVDDWRVSTLANCAFAMGFAAVAAALSRAECTDPVSSTSLV